jgi:hypothetical protein
MPLIKDVLVECEPGVEKVPRFTVTVDGLCVFSGIGARAFDVGGDVATAFTDHLRNGVSLEDALAKEGQPVECDCGCGMILPGGHLERAHPEDYRYDERA